MVPALSRSKRSVYASRYYLKNKEVIAAKRKQYVKDNKEKVKAQNAEKYLKNKAKYQQRFRNYWFKGAYGITLNQWNEMFKRQGHKCAICSVPKESLPQRDWCVDHDHVTGKVRGILCITCNLLLGYAKDSELNLLRAIEYLKETL